MVIKSIIQDGQGTSITAGINSEHSLKTVETKNNIPVAVDIDSTLDSENQSGILSMAVDSQGKTTYLSADSDHCLQVNLKHANPQDAIHVVVSNGPRIFHMDYAINSATPAVITSSEVDIFDVGGDNFTITINGDTPAEVISFPNRAATSGYLRGGINPNPKDGWPNDEEKIKVSVDGGALTEVEIGKTHNNWDQVANALQTKIRTEVPNGADVVVLWNSTEFPYRMAAWSASTGNSSSIHFEKGGDDLAKDMQTMIGYDYQEIDGTNTDVYHIDEVAELLSPLPGVYVTYDSSITLTTSATGSSASLQVSSGGANTVLGFPTTEYTGQNGTGSQNLAADGSSISLYFKVPVPSGRVFVIEQLIVLMKANGAQLKKFGGITELTNGFQIEFRQENQETRALVNALTNAELFAYADSGEIIIDAFADNFEIVKALFSFPNGIRIREGTPDTIQVLVRDDLTSEDNEYIYLLAKGWLEV